MSRYQYELKMDNLNSHSKILNKIKPKTHVLEIGTAYGHMTRYLKEELECEITGIDINKEMLDYTSQYLEKAILLNVDDIEKLDEKLSDEYFDYIILGDVLEHCYTPIEILRVLKNKVKHSGRIIISVPNVAHNAVLMELLRDRFSYYEDGLLDYTHIRWYTQSSFREGIKHIGLYIVGYDSTYAVPEHLNTHISYDEYTLLEKECLINHMNGHVFQNIFELSKDASLEQVNINPVSSYNYDEINIDTNKERQKYFVHQLCENVEYVLKEDTQKIKIYPTMRMRQYTIHVKVNEEILLSDIIWKNGVKRSDHILALKDHYLILNHNFKKDDKLSLTVKYNNIEESDILEAMKEKEANKEVSKLTQEIDNIKAVVQQADIVSFDIFDTLLLRNVLNPIDIFKIVENEYNKNYSETLRFKDLRIKAEEKARIRSKEEDITFDDIYRVLEEDIGEKAKLLKVLELKIEQEFLIPNERMKQIFSYAKELKKKILIISDMYLSKDSLEKILKQCGYSDYDELYVSSEIKVTKATGTIYSYIRKQHNIKDNVKWCHIGDNLISDVKNAELHGIKGVHYKRLSEREVLDEKYTIAESIIKSIQINQKYQGKNEEYWYNFGVEFIAPIYIGFVSWLSGVVEGKDNLYFLARDGYIPHKLYNMIQAQNENLPEGKYIYASRRGYQYPHLLKVHKNEAIAILTAFNSNLGQTITLKEILSNIGLDSIKYLDKIHQFNIPSCDAPIEYGESLHNVRKFLCHIWDDIELVLQEELKLLQEYFKQVGMDEYEKINIVDIGWRGSTQLAIKDILEKEINGYYFGTLENMYGDIMSNSYGYAFDLGVPLDKRSFIMNNVMLYELIFSAPEKSLIKFKKEVNGNISPILKNVENNEEIYKYISYFQEGAMQVFKEYLKYVQYMDKLNKAFCLKPFEDFIIRKNLVDLIKFKELRNSVGFGESKDCKDYVSVIEKEYYINNRDEVKARASMNLWPEAILIRDEYGRMLVPNEVDSVVPNTILPNKNNIKIKSIIILAKKCIKNPKKAVNRASIILKNKIKR